MPLPSHPNPFLTVVPPPAAPLRSDDDFKALLTRWFQFGMFTPIYRVHGTNGANSTYGTEYWLYGAETERDMNATNSLRHRLLVRARCALTSPPPHAALSRRADTGT